MTLVEKANARRQAEQRDAAANWTMIADDFEEMMRYGDYGGVEG